MSFWGWGLNLGGGGSRQKMAALSGWDTAFGDEWNHSFASFWDTAFGA